MNNGYKIYMNILNNRLKYISEHLLNEEQSGFRKGRSCTDNIFITKQVIEKRREVNLETHIAFIDFEKAINRVMRSKLWEIIKKKCYPQHLIQSYKVLYKNTKIIIDMGFKTTEAFLTNSGLRQECSHSPTLFNIYMG